MIESWTSSKVVEVSPERDEEFLSSVDQNDITLTLFGSSLFSIPEALSA